MKKGIYALSLGTFGLGIAEYVMMGILPDMAIDLEISVAKAGHLISAYALGVCVGAPIIALFARNYPLRKISILLLFFFTVGSFFTAISSNYWFAICARFITGLPHGAYFGVGVIIANRLAPEGKRTSAIAIMVMGMTIANLIGVPIFSWVGHSLSWRIIFVFAAVWGIMTIWLTRCWIPIQNPLPKTNVKQMFAFLKKSAPWLLVISTILVNGGIFCFYSYINTFMTDTSGFCAGSIPIIMLLAGGSMCIGNYLGGKFSDKYSPLTVVLFCQVIACISLIFIFFFASIGIVSVLLMCITIGALFGLSSPQQQLLLQHSPGGEMMGGAMVQLAFNLGNALGAFSGGLILEDRMKIEYTSLFGSIFVLFGIFVLMIFAHKYVESD